MYSSKDVKTFLEISRVVNSKLGLAQVFQTVYTYLACLLNFDAGRCYWYHKKGFTPVQELSTGLEEDCTLLDKQREENALLEKVVTTCRSWILSSIVVPGEYKNESFSCLGKPYAMGAPVMADGILMGVIILEREDEDFTVFELNQLELAVNMLGWGVQKRVRQEYSCSHVECNSNNSHGQNVLENLTSGVAREIRRPLANIKMAFYSLARNVSGYSGVEPDLEQMEDSLERMDKALDFLLNLSGDLELNLEQADLNRLNDEALDVIRTTLAPEVLVTRSYDTLPPVEVDREKIISVLTHIIENAVDAMPVGGTLRIITTGKEGRVCIVFEDDGVGIDENIKFNLFDPFVSSKPQGTGLGLTICKRIVELHGGSITIRSNTGKGATVTLEIPLPQP